MKLQMSYKKPCNINAFVDLVAGSTPAASTILIAGRTPECEIIVLRYGFWLALDLTVQA